MPKTGLEDKRLFARFPVNFLLECQELNSQGKYYAHAFDISANGLGLVTDTKLHPATLLGIWINTPNSSNPLYTEGKVAWVRAAEHNRYRMGVQLKDAALTGVARVLYTNRLRQQDVVKEELLKSRGFFVELYYNILGFIKRRQD